MDDEKSVWVSEREREYVLENMMVNRQQHGDLSPHLADSLTCYFSTLYLFALVIYSFINKGDERVRTIANGGW